MILTLIRKAVLVAAAAGCFLLVARAGVGTAAVVWAAGSAIACVVGVWLLRTSAIGRVTWKNRVAAYLIPWGWQFGDGRLGRVAVLSWCGWVAIATGVIVLMPPAEAAAPGYGWRVALGTVWAVDAGALAYVAGTIHRHFSFTTGRGGHSLRVVGAVLVGLLTTSGAFYALGWPYLAVAVAGGPPLVVGVGYGLFLGMLIVFGRGRWN